MTQKTKRRIFFWKFTFCMQSAAFRDSELQFLRNQHHEAIQALALLDEKLAVTISEQNALKLDIVKVASNLFMYRHFSRLKNQMQE